MLTFEDISQPDELFIMVYRDGHNLGSIEEFEGELRYAHYPDRISTFRSIRQEELREIVKRMDEIEL